MRRKFKFILRTGLFLATGLSMLVGMTACDKGYEKYNGMYFQKITYEGNDENKPEYYVAGGFCSKSSEYETYFIPASINDIPVKKLGATIFVNEGIGNIVGHKELGNIYIPGSITNSSVGGYFYIREYSVGNAKSFNRSDLNIYYCGKTISLGMITPYAGKYYVPAEQYEEFLNYYVEPSYMESAEKTNQELQLKKANVSYRLNAEELDEYYYVDYVEYGEKIKNVPPEPEREGYEFEGWYTEENCENKWNFEGDNLPVLSDGADFCELKLFAKWKHN